MPVLIDEGKGAAGNPWGFEYATKLFDMADDSGLFRTAAQLAEAGFLREGANWIAALGPRRQRSAQIGGEVDRWLPLLEAKLIHLFDHRWATYEDGDSRDVTSSEKADSAFELTPRYWVPEREVEKRLRAKGWSRGWLMGWRDITNTTSERSVVATTFPRSGVGHTLRLMAVGQPVEQASAFLANGTSLLLDYVAKQKIGGTHLTVEMWKQFPILPPSAYTEADLAFIVSRVLELTYTSHAMAPFARDLGYDGPPFPWDEERRALLRAELDAWYARAYGLTRDELRYILDPADVKGADYPSETFRVLKSNELKKHGEYRTQRLVLEAWDRMEADGRFAGLGLGAASAAPAVVELPHLADLPNAAWAWPAGVQPRDRLRYAAQYALWQMDPAIDGTRVRFVIASLAEPALLTPLLATGDRKQWVRLVGPEAQTAQGTVRLRPELNAAWRSMFETLLASGQLEEGADGAWARGRDFSPAGLHAASADAQRAAFAIRAVRSMDIGSLTAAVAADDNVIWVRFGSGQAG
jgi:hypothetical protein